MDARDDLDDSMISWLVDARDVCFLSSKKMSAVFVSSDQVERQQVISISFRD